MGIHSMLTAKGFFVDELSVIDMHPGLRIWWTSINTIANAPFVFLPVLLGFSATRKFGGNPFLGAALGMLLVHPALADGWNYALTLAQGKIQYWNVLVLRLKKSAIKVPLSNISFCLGVSNLRKTFRKFVPLYLDNPSLPHYSHFIVGFFSVYRNRSNWSKRVH